MLQVSAIAVGVAGAVLPTAFGDIAYFLAILFVMGVGVLTLVVTLGKQNGIPADLERRASEDSSTRE